MPRSYRHIKDYETEILRLKEQGLTNREIGKKLGFTLEQTKNFVKRHNANQRKIEAGIAIHKKGRPAKNSVVSKTDKVSELRYQLARKESKIRQLEMENELWRDFLSLTDKG